MKTRPSKARLLSQAVEWGIRAVLTSWDAPVAKADKLWSAFDDPIAGLLDPEVTTWAQQVRAVRPVLAATLLSAAGANLEAIIRLAENNPPTGWRPTGTNRDDSDFDLLLILPDTVPENLAGQAMGQVWQTARRAATSLIIRRSLPRRGPNRTSSTRRS